MRIYVSGPISGREDQNRDAFARAAARIKLAGHTPITPFDLPEILGDGDDETYWKLYMLRDMEYILNSKTRPDALYMLPEWKTSKGARVEHAIAMSGGIRVFMPSDTLPGERARLTNFDALAESMEAMAGALSALSPCESCAKGSYATCDYRKQTDGEAYCRANILEWLKQEKKDEDND